MAARFAGLPEGVARPARLRAHAGRARKRMGARPRIQARQAAAARREHAGPAGPIQAESSAHRSACVAVARPRRSTARRPLRAGTLHRRRRGAPGRGTRPGTGDPCSARRSGPLMRRRTLLLLLALCQLTVQVNPGHAQEAEERPTIPFEGPELFAYLLHSRGYSAVTTTLGAAPAPPKDILLILFGELDGLPSVLKPYRDLRDFQAKGGSVLVASDYPRTLP